MLNPSGDLGTTKAFLFFFGRPRDKNGNMWGKFPRLVARKNPATSSWILPFYHLFPSVYWQAAKLKSSGHLSISSVWDQSVWAQTFFIQSVHTRIVRLLSAARFILSESVPYIFGLLTISKSIFKLNVRY